MISKELLEILCCPKCKADLVYDQSARTLTCRKCGTVYPVKDDIPMMLIDEADQPR